MWLAVDPDGELDCDVTGLGVAEARKLKELIKKIQKRGGVMARIKVKVLNEGCTPERTHRWDAGWDLKSTERITVPKGEMVKVRTGVITEIPARHFGMVVPRSSMGVKHRVTLANDVGIIDAEYRGEIFVFLTNDGDHDMVIEQYQRFCQLLIVPVNNAELWIVDQLSKTDRGDGGFGSTTESQSVIANPNNDGTAVFVEEKPIEIPEEKKTSTGTTTIEEKRQAKLDELKKLSVAEYMKLKNSGKLMDEYPIATGDMKEDLCL